MKCKDCGNEYVYEDTLDELCPWCGGNEIDYTRQRLAMTYCEYCGSIKAESTPPGCAICGISWCEICQKWYATGGKDHEHGN